MGESVREICFINIIVKKYFLLTRMKTVKSDTPRGDFISSNRYFIYRRVLFGIATEFGTFRHLIW